MLETLKTEAASRISERIRVLWGIEHDPVVEIPPRRELGDLAFPVALHLARQLKRNPRQIATELIEGLEMPREVREVRVEGAGYINLFFDRGAFAHQLLDGDWTLDEERRAGEKVVVEHTNINPNKAAHIGHLRNAVLGDVLARVLEALGHPVEIQNYIDDTGVQLADVVVGFMDIEALDEDAVREIPEPFDYYCWDLYSRVGAWYEEDPELRNQRLELRQETLMAMEDDAGPRASLARLIARRVVQRHLTTMGRLDIAYQLLTHESAILGLDFFSEAFEQLKQSGAVRLESDGKNVGCWVMPLAETEEFAGLEDPDKVIVRSNGTVTYVGKDIAYQLWKFGLLARDFEYRLWEEENVWETGVEGVADHPEFGGAHTVVNVIDARQSYLQKIVRAGLDALGHSEEASRSIHFAYEMVSLSAETARQLGYIDGASDASGSLEMSGRKGIGVKADDLLDQMVAKSREEIAERNREMAGEELDHLAQQIATAAVRFFMVKATTTRVILFDLEEALSFEGESGPYLQYSLVRARNIQRRLEAAGRPTSVAGEELERVDAEVWSDDLWDLILTTARIGEIVERAGSTLELSMIARHALELAQQFHAIYHRHPILHEEREELRTARLGTTQIFVRGLEQLASLLGIPTPERM